MVRSIVGTLVNVGPIRLHLMTFNATHKTEIKLGFSILHAFGQLKIEYDYL
jgi:hypothetical protein